VPRRRLRKRQPIIWTPEWGKAYEGWSVTFIKHNIWRVDHIHDFDDLLQEAYLTFQRVSYTYPRVVDEKHFMALFKRAMINKMHDRSCAKRRKEKVEAPLSQEVADFFTRRIGEVTNAGYMAALLDEMPEELKLALNIIISRDTPFRKNNQQITQREGLGTALVRMLKLPKATLYLGTDPLSRLRELLKN
jgi:hypothetical protein